MAVLCADGRCATALTVLCDGEDADPGATARGFPPGARSWSLHNRIIGYRAPGRYIGIIGHDTVAA